METKYRIDTLEFISDAMGCYWLECASANTRERALSLYKAIKEEDSINGAKLKYRLVTIQETYEDLDLLEQAKENWFDFDNLESMTEHDLQRLKKVLIEDNDKDVIDEFIEAFKDVLKKYEKYPSSVSNFSYLLWKNGILFNMNQDDLYNILSSVNADVRTAFFAGLPNEYGARMLYSNPQYRDFLND